MVGIITATPEDGPEMHSYADYREYGHCEMLGDDGNSYSKNHGHYRRIKPEYRQALFQKSKRVLNNFIKYQFIKIKLKK